MDHTYAEGTTPSLTLSHPDRSRARAAFFNAGPSEIGNRLQSLLALKYDEVRSTTRSLFATLSAEDQMVQSCADASPVKWHQAHTTWFFETFVLRPFLSGYTPFREEFRRLFNSYYISLGENIPEKKLRSSFSRPSLEEIVAFREHVDQAMQQLLEHPVDDEVIGRILLGLNHEQQHQELALTDIKHAFFTNPLRPPYRSGSRTRGGAARTPELLWFDVPGGLTDIGSSQHSIDPLGFCFDNETPRHTVYLQPFQIASRKVTCREYLEFMSDDGYSRPDLWLSDGWEIVKRAKWQAPLYWERDAAESTGWKVFTLRGWHSLSDLLDTPVCHVSFFEADAFAKWCSHRLPTEAEWESIASLAPPQGNFLETALFHPASAHGAGGIGQIFGDCWEWTASAYAGHPDTNLFLGLWANTTQNLCPHR